MRLPIRAGLPFLLLAACGGAPPKPVDPPVASVPSAAPATTAAPVASATPAMPAAPAAGAAGSPAQDELDDKAESKTPITMAALFTKTNKPAFPKSTVGDKECWSTISLSGDHQKDFDNIVSKCGAATGLVEYAKPQVGHLHHQHDKRDTFRLNLMNGMCYRYFAVADSGIKDLDILVEKPNGAIVADDKQESPVAIIEASKPWCMTEDATYDFHIEVDGVGKGKYAFGVWAKPK